MNTTLESVKVLIERRKNLIDELNRINSQLVVGYERCILEIVAGRLSAEKLSEVIVPVVPTRVEMRKPNLTVPENPLVPSMTPPVPSMTPQEMNKLSQPENSNVERVQTEETPIETPTETAELIQTRTESEEIVETPKSAPPNQPNPLNQPNPKSFQHPPNCPCEENNIAPPREVHVPLSARAIEESEKYQRAKAQQDKNISDWIDSFNSKSDAEKKVFRDKYLLVLKQKVQELIPLPNKDGVVQVDDDVKLAVQRRLNIEYYTRLLKVLQDYSINENGKSNTTKKGSELADLD
jgi:hypothetical protein